MASTVRSFRLLLFFAITLLAGVPAFGQNDPIPGGQMAGAAPDVQSSSSFVLARLKYSGGGDWYNDQAGDVNMLDFLRKHTTINVRPAFEYVDLTSDNIF